MNYRSVFRTIGNILVLESIILIIPLLVAGIYREPEQAKAFLATIVISALTGLLLMRIPQKHQHIRAHDGLMIVGLTWIIVSLIGALPFIISGQIPNYLDAVFETISGFTTSGSSILNDVENIGMSLRFWRCFTNWLGGMGLLVFMLALIPFKHENMIHLLRAESTGADVTKLVPRMRTTALIMYGIYISLSLIEFVFLLIGGMPIMDSINTALSTAGTGGFSMWNDSIAHYNSPYVNIVTSVFMILFGVNFTVYFLLIIGKTRSALKNKEVIIYILILVFSVISVAVNIRPMFDSWGESAMHSLFTVSSIMSTTGFSTVDFNLWPTYSKMLLILLMMVGACASSTAGGIKISRIMILFKAMYADLITVINPRRVRVIRFDENVISRKTVNGVYSFMCFYALIAMCSILLLSLDHLDIETTVTAVITTINDIGPGMGQVGPAANFSIMSPLSKIVLCFDMLAGRLEIIPIIILFTPMAWRKY